MKKVILSFIVSTAIVSTMVLTSCDHYFGKKTDLSFIDTNITYLEEVAYIPIQPIIKGFVRPTDVIAGFDNLIYVVDAGAEEIVSFDQSGKRLGRYQLKGVKAIAQDRSLDILAIATFDTLGATYDAIYRLELKNSVYGIAGAQVQKKIVHPFYIKNVVSATDKDVRLNSIGILADNSYYVSRTGPASSIIGNDNSIWFFNKEDKAISPLQFTTSLGTSSDIGAPYALTTLAMPPQSNVVSQSADFIFSTNDANSALKVKYVSVSVSDAGTEYKVKDLGFGDTSKADGFLYTPSRFGTVSDITFAGDGTNYLWVTDTEKDSLYQFTNTGYEGVKAPPAANTTKYVKVSFGGTGNGPMQFNNPSGVAYINRILYVADTDNQRLLRFKLTTDLD